MVQKISFLLLFAAICISMVLPFQEFESMWADFNVSGFFNMNQPENHKIRGYELILPLLSILFTGLTLFLSGFGKTKNSRIAGFVFSVINMVFVIYMFSALITPATAVANSMFRPPTPLLGSGFFLLLISSTLILITSLVVMTKK